MDIIKGKQINMNLPSVGEKPLFEAPRNTDDGVQLTDDREQRRINLTNVPMPKALCDPENPIEFPRPMNDWEKADFKEAFPALDVDNAVVTGEATPEYNCISWTVGETHQWFWPPYMFPDLSEEEAFDTFYASYGFTPAQSGEVARWRNDEGLTHGCVSGPDHGPRWESKCGSDLRIQHDLNELEGNIYGKVDGYYTQAGGEQPMPPSDPVEIPEEMKKAASKIASKVDKGVREKFAASYSNWLDFRKSPAVRFSANPAAYCKTKAFEEITSLGTAAIPLLMEKITHGDFFCLQAIDKIKSECSIASETAHFELEPKDRQTSEQNRAAITFMKWYEAR